MQIILQVDGEYFGLLLDISINNGLILQWGTEGGIPRFPITKTVMLPISFPYTFSAIYCYSNYGIAYITGIFTGNNSIGHLTNTTFDISSNTDNMINWAAIGF